MRELVAPAAHLLSLDDDTGPQGLVEQVEEAILALRAHPDHHVEGEPSGHGRGDREHPVAGVAQAREPPANDLTDPLGDALLDEGGVPHPAPLPPRDGAGLREVPEHLLDEERVPLRLPVDGLDERLRGLLLADRADQRLHLCERESPQENPLVETFAAKRGHHLGQRMGPFELDVAVGSDDENPIVPRPAREVLHQKEGRLVGPVEIVENEDERALRSDVPDERRDALEQAQAFGLPLERRGLRNVREALADLGDERRHLRGA